MYTSRRSVPIVDMPNQEYSVELENLLLERFLWNKSGLILDTKCSNDPQWLVSASSLLKWFSNVEDVLAQPIGRRIAHAAAESEEWRMSLLGDIPKPIFKRQKKQLEWLNSEWESRGLGQLKYLPKISEIQEELEVKIKERVLTALSAGMGNAAIEYILSTRTKFRWQDQGEKEGLIFVQEDKKDVPSAQEFVPSWINRNKLSFDKHQRSENYNPLKRPILEFPGNWELFGVRHHLIGLDFINRLDDIIKPYLAEHTIYTDSRTEWNATDKLDKEGKILWDAYAESACKLFIESGNLAMVAEPEHWRGICETELSEKGLGELISVESIDSHGGIEMKFSQIFHPALVTGILLGCWSRAEGRNAAANWEQNSDFHSIKLYSQREIA